MDLASGIYPVSFKRKKKDVYRCVCPGVPESRHIICFSRVICREWTFSDTNSIPCVSLADSFKYRSFD